MGVTYRATDTSLQRKVALKIIKTDIAEQSADARERFVREFDAGLGHKDLAIREAQHAVELMPISKDIYDGALVLEGLAQVYAWSGERDRAVELLQRLVTMPGYTNYGRLKLHQLWSPLRGHAQFEKIVAALAPK